MSSCTFLEIDGEYINPDNINKFTKYAKNYTKICFDRDYIIVQIDIDDFKNMLRESNWFIKSKPVRAEVKLET